MVNDTTGGITFTAQQNRPTTSNLTSFSVRQTVADHEGSRRVDVELDHRALEMSDAGLPAAAGVFRPMRTIKSGVKDDSACGQQLNHPSMHALGLTRRDQTAANARLGCGLVMQSSISIWACA